MLTSLRITGFRNFSSLTMNGLTRVNLLVGENNAGKTSVLEALEILLLAQSNPLVVANGPMRRGENIARPQSDSSEGLPEESDSLPKDIDLRHLFHGRETYPGSSFELQGQATLNPLSVKCVIELFSNISSDSDLGAVDAVSPGIALIIGARTRYLSLEHSLKIIRLRQRRYLAAASANTLTTVQFIETAAPRPQSLTELWDDIVLNPEEKNVTEALQIIEPQIERIASLSSTAFGRDGIFVKLKRSERRVPLGSMGEGIKRLLVLAMNLVTSASGYLLIDEIDTGLHYSVMVKMWKLVAETARRLNIQVFATSHSLDCIQALAALYEREPDVRDDISLHRIERGAPASIRYSAEEILSAAQRQVEVR